MRDDLDLVQALAELERAIRPEPGPLCVIGMHAKRRDAGVREAQLASRRKVLAGADRLAGCPLRLLYSGLGK